MLGGGGIATPIGFASVPEKREKQIKANKQTNKQEQNKTKTKTQQKLNKNKTKTKTPYAKAKDKTFCG